ncbi:hypothetical protein BSNT_07054 [Bacillus subtilis subsp. natto BEST195]|nr:hypothetical protein BSNT_07054 [Bacillus subtilis subsp. natto BEST195]
MFSALFTKSIQKDIEKKVANFIQWDTNNSLTFSRR